MRAWYEFGMPPRFVVALLAVLLVGVALAAGPARPFVSRAAHELGLRKTPQAARPGAAFPALDLTNLDGTPAQPPSSGTVVYNVFTSWCPSCNEELPELLRAQATLKKHGIAFIGIDQGESAGRVQAFIAARGIPYPVLIDSAQSTTTLLGARVIPETVIVRNGKIEQILVGPMTAVELQRAVANV